MSQYKPYPAYKDSGVEWLGRVPEHWDTRRLGQIGTFSKGSGGNKQDELPTGIPCIRYGDLYTTHTRFILQSRSCVAPERAADYMPIKYGDILFAASGETVEEIGKSATNLIRDPACCGGDVIVFRPHIAVDPRYMGYAVDCQPAAYQKSGMGKGFTVVHIYPSQLRNLLLSLPPLSEQRRIAAFLDRETARIDALIEKKQRLIELLKEKLQAVITQAVTKGLDPKVPMKDSGVEWLGEVPEHWRIVAVSWFAQVYNGATPSRGQADYWEGDLPWLSSGKVNDWVIKEPSERITPEAVIAAGLQVVPKGSVVIGMVGQGRTRGMSARLAMDTFINQNMAAIIPKRSLNPIFLHYVLTHSYESIREYGRGGQQDALNCELVGSLRIPLPPEDEQTIICDYLDKQLLHCEGLATKTQDSIELLRDRCSALITAAVTGQIDVRDT